MTITFIRLGAPWKPTRLCSLVRASGSSSIRGPERFIVLHAWHIDPFHTDLERRSSMNKSFVRGTWQKSRSFSPAVITEGGKVIWIAGHTGQKDQAGKSLAGDFEAQMRQTFKNIETTLMEAGASLKDIVTMTVFLPDSRYTTRMTEIRTEILGEDFPASAAIT